MNTSSRRLAGAVCGMLVAATALAACAAPLTPGPPSAPPVVPSAAKPSKQENPSGDPIPTHHVRSIPATGGTGGPPLPAPSGKPSPKASSSSAPRPNAVQTLQSLPPRDPVKPMG